MGADEYSVSGRGRSAREVFNELVSQAAYEYGHGGYTGSIAEKRDFIMVECPREVIACPEALRVFIDLVMDEDDKWGPANCLELEAPTADKLGRWAFFGWASS